MLASIYTHTYSLKTVLALGQFAHNIVLNSRHDVEAELCALLTRPMVERLDSPDDFLALFAGETFNPEIVWGEVNRAELAVWIKEAFQNIHVTSPQTPSGPSLARAPLWGQELFGGGHASLHPPGISGTSGSIPLATGLASGFAAEREREGEKRERGERERERERESCNSLPNTPNSSRSSCELHRQRRRGGPTKDHCFSNLRGLTRVGGVYIEVLNRDPSWQVDDPASLLGKLFDAIAHGVDGRPSSMQQRKEALQVWCM